MFIENFYISPQKLAGDDPIDWMGVKPPVGYGYDLGKGLYISVEMYRTMARMSVANMPDLPPARRSSGKYGGGRYCA